MNRRGIVTQIWHAVAAAFLAALVLTIPAAACPYRVDDGDTMTVIATGEVIRMRGYDTPEVGKYAWCEAERRLGMAAWARAEQLVCGGGAVVEIDRGEAPAVDRYRRTLAVVRVDGEDLATVMVREGWARPYAGGRRKGWCGRDSRDDLVPSAPDDADE